MIKNKQSMLIVSITLLSVALVFSFSIQTTIAREEMSVQIVPFSTNEVTINTQVELVANAKGGSGQYLYR